jgi:hypothetical protein
MSFLDDSGSGPATEGQPVESPENQPAQLQEPQLSPYAQNFLQGVPEEERGVVSKYLPKWDGGFTQYAQRVQGELKSYKDLGNAEELRAARQVYDRLINDPESVVNWLAEQGYKYNAQGEIVPSNQPNQPNQSQNQQSQSPDPYADRWQKMDRMERALGLVAENFQKQQQAAEQAQAERELDNYLSEFKKAHGNVPEQFILAYLNANVVDPMQIAGEWQKITQGAINQRAAAKPPNIMGSSSQPPVAQDPANYTTDQRQQALLARLGDFGSS